ncbi:MAG: HD domain-containing protein [Muribaculaceae bacterium]|nr:HD domain-containing protein [Muribaculaceae bacterium]
MPIDIKANRERFIQILRDTNRENMDYVIEDLDSWGFFDAPASARNHFNFPGGLAMHSLNVYDMAMAVRSAIIPLRPDMEKALNPDSIAIAALLHDVCKTDIYRKTRRKQRNEIGVWEEIEGYEVDYSNLPVGHGEKSVIMLLRSGLDLEDEEIFAIRWHMGPWDLPAQSIEMDKSYRKAHDRSPLVALIHTADTLAAQILERDAARLS